MQSILQVLITPIQRIPRYQLLLEALEKKMPELHPYDCRLVVGERALTACVPRASAGTLSSRAKPFARSGWWP
jgi:hypothetical protein